MEYKALSNFGEAGKQITITHYGVSLFLGISIGYVVFTLSSDVIKVLLYNRYNTPENIPEGEKPIIEFAYASTFHFTAPLQNSHWVWLGL